MRKKHLIIVACVVIAVGIGATLVNRFMSTKDIVQLKEPDGHLSGFWGEIWYLNEEKAGRITLYYDEEGYVDNVIIDTAPGIVPSENKLIYGDQPAFDELGLTKGDIVIPEKGGILKSPPKLMVTCAKEQVTALLGTYSWEYQNMDGTGTGIESDSMHPLESKEYMENLSLGYSYLSSIDSFQALLQFEVVPDEVKICYWSTDYWNEPATESKDLEVQAVDRDLADGSHTKGYQVRLLEGNYVYEVTAKWSGSEEYSGTAHYSFYTVMGDYEMIPIEENE